MPRLCDRCGREIDDYAAVGRLVLLLEQHGEPTKRDDRQLCAECARLVVGTDPLLEGLQQLEMTSLDTRRETALMAATQTLDAAATPDELLAVADRFLEWLRSEDDEA
jgi:hypothetical protein